MQRDVNICFHVATLGSFDIEGLRTLSFVIIPPFRGSLNGLAPMMEHTSQRTLAGWNDLSRYENGLISTLADTSKRHALDIPTTIHHGQVPWESSGSSRSPCHFSTSAGAEPLPDLRAGSRTAHGPISDF